MRTAASGSRQRQRAWIAAAAVAFLATLYLMLGVIIGRHFTIPSAGMAPTYPIGADVWVYRFGTPERGDAVVFERPRSDPATASLPGELFKRVVAVGGQTVSSEGGHLVVDGRRVIEPYLARGTRTEMVGTVRVPRGKLFVMGDARPVSLDSRYYGPIDADSVVGVVHLDW